MYQVTGSVPAGDWISFDMDGIDPTDPAWWTPLVTTFDRYIGWEQSGKNPIGTPLAVTLTDPRFNAVEPVLFTQRRNGVVVQHLENSVPSVFLKYREAPPTYTSSKWASGTYESGARVFHEDSGECYLASTTVSVEPPGTGWSRIEFPVFLAPAVKAMAYGDFLVGDGQHEKADLQRTLALDLLVRELDKVEYHTDQNRQYLIQPRGTRRLHTNQNDKLPDTLDKVGAIRHAEAMLTSPGVRISIGEDDLRFESYRTSGVSISVALGLSTEAQKVAERGVSISIEFSSSATGAFIPVTARAYTLTTFGVTATGHRIVSRESDTQINFSLEVSGHVGAGSFTILEGANGGWPSTFLTNPSTVAGVKLSEDGNTVMIVERTSASSHPSISMTYSSTSLFERIGVFTYTGGNWVAKGDPIKGAELPGAYDANNCYACLSGDGDTVIVGEKEAETVSRWQWQNNAWTKTETLQLLQSEPVVNPLPGKPSHWRIKCTTDGRLAVIGRPDFAGKHVHTGLTQYDAGHVSTVTFERSTVGPHEWQYAAIGYGGVSQMKDTYNTNALWGSDVVCTPSGHWIGCLTNSGMQLRQNHTTHGVSSRGTWTGSSWVGASASITPSASRIAVYFGSGEGVKVWEWDSTPDPTMGYPDGRYMHLGKSEYYNNNYLPDHGQMHTGNAVRFAGDGTLLLSAKGIAGSADPILTGIDYPGLMTTWEWKLGDFTSNHTNWPSGWGANAFQNQWLWEKTGETIYAGGPADGLLTGSHKGDKKHFAFHSDISLDGSTIVAAARSPHEFIGQGVFIYRR